MTPPLTRLIEQERASLLAWVRKHAGTLLKRDTAEDLAQIVCVHALEHGEGLEFSKGGVSDDTEPALLLGHRLLRPHRRGADGDAGGIVPQCASWRCAGRRLLPRSRAGRRSAEA